MITVSTMSSLPCSGWQPISEGEISSIASTQHLSSSAPFITLSKIGPPLFPKKITNEMKQITSHYTEELSDFTTRLLIVDWNERPRIDECLEHWSNYVSDFKAQSRVKLHVENIDICLLTGDTQLFEQICEDIHDGPALKLHLETQQRNRRLPILTVTQYGHINLLILMEEFGVDVTMKDPITGDTAMHIAARYGKLSVAKYLLQRFNFMCDIKNFQLQTPLAVAAEYGQIDIVRAILKRGFTYLESRDITQRTPLLLAAIFGHYEVAKLLVEKGANFGAVIPENGYNALHIACEFGYFNIMKMLAETENALSLNVSTPTKNDNWPIHIAALHGHLDIAKYLIEKIGQSVSFRGELGRTPLHLCAKEGSLEMAKYLVIEKQADIFSRDETAEQAMPIHQAIMSENAAIVQFLIETDPSLLNQKLYNGDSLLHCCVRSHYPQTSLMRELIHKYEMPVDAVGGSGQTSLLKACRLGKFESAKYLYQVENANVNAVDCDGNNVLHLSAQAGDSRLFFHFLTIKFSLSTQLNNYCRTPLLEAIKCNSEKILDIFLESYSTQNGSTNSPYIKELFKRQYAQVLKCYAALGRDTLLKQLLDVGGGEGFVRTEDIQDAMMLACEHGHLNFILRLLETRPCRQLFPISYWGESALTVASLNGNMEILRELLAYSDFNLFLNSPMHRTPPLTRAVQGRHLAVVRFLLDYGAQINAVTSDGENSALMIAAYLGFGEIAQHLINRSANVNQQNADGYTAAMLGVIGGNIDSMEFIFNTPAVDFTIKNNAGANCLHLAASRGLAEIVQAILMKSPELLNSLDGNGQTALILASNQGNADVVQLLIDLGSEILISSSNSGINPLMAAAINGWLDAQRIILKKLPRPVLNQVDAEGKTALMLAAQAGHIDMIQLLIVYGADVNFCEESGPTALTSALMAGQVKAGHCLIEHASANVDLCSENGWSPLMIASANPKLCGIVDLLLRKGGNVNQSDENGITALLIAARKGHQDVVKALIAHGADVNAKDARGNTGCHLASKYGHHGILDALIAAGAKPEPSNMS